MKKNKQRLEKVNAYKLSLHKQKMEDEEEQVKKFKEEKSILLQN